MDRLLIDDSQTIMKNPTGPGDSGEMQSNDPSRGDWFPDMETVMSIAPGAKVFREPTKEPDMNPEVTLPWDNKDDNKDQNEPSIKEKSLEDHLINNVMEIMRMSSYLTILFTEHGSNIFIDKNLSSELTSILLAMNVMVDLVGTTVAKIAISEEET